MKRLQENKHALLVLRNAKPELRRNMIKHVPDEVIKAISEIAHNFLARNVKICPKTLTSLKPYKNTIRKVSEPNRKVSSKRKLLVQSGAGVIPFLILSNLQWQKKQSN